jgi:ketosteroid isomerase-like protein
MHQHIQADNDAFTAALAAGDANAIAAVYSPNARLLAPDSELLTGTGAIAGYWQAGIAAGIRSAELTTLTIEERDDLAIEVGRYTLQIQPDGGDPVTDTGKYVVVHRRNGTGNWRWDLDIFNSTHRRHEPVGDLTQLTRLAAVKAQYDPDNTFKHNHNIQPKPARTGADR